MTALDLTTHEGRVQDTQALMDSGLKELLPPDLKSGEVSIMPPVKGEPWREVFVVRDSKTIIYRRLDADGTWETLYPVREYLTE